MRTHKTLWIAIGMIAFGCHDNPPEAPAPEALESAAPAPQEEVDDEDEAPGEADPGAAIPEVLDDATLDTLTEEQIEIACFQGHQAACDRMGH